MGFQLTRHYKEPCDKCGDEYRLISVWENNYETNRRELIASHLLCDSCGAKRCVSQDVLESRPL